MIRGSSPADNGLEPLRDRKDDQNQCHLAGNGTCDRSGMLHRSRCTKVVQCNAYHEVSSEKWAGNPHRPGQGRESGREIIDHNEGCADLVGKLRQSYWSRETIRHEMTGLPDQLPTTENEDQRDPDRYDPIAIDRDLSLAGGDIMLHSCFSRRTPRLGG